MNFDGAIARKPRPPRSAQPAATVTNHQTVIVNYTDEPHRVRVEPVVGGEPVGVPELVTVPAGEAAVVPTNTPGAADEFTVSGQLVDGESVVSSAVARPQVMDQPSPSGGPVAHGIAPETAVSLFGILSGIGGAASQLLASRQLAGVSGEISTLSLAPALALSIAGAIAGAFLLPTG